MQNIQITIITILYIFVCTRLEKSKRNGMIFVRRNCRGVIKQNTVFVVTRKIEQSRRRGKQQHDNVVQVRAPRSRGHGRSAESFEFRRRTDYNNVVVAVEEPSETICRTIAAAVSCCCDYCSFIFVFRAKAAIDET